MYYVYILHLANNQLYTGYTAAYFVDIICKKEKKTVFFVFMLFDLFQYCFILVKSVLVDGLKDYPILPPLFRGCCD